MKLLTFLEEAEYPHTTFVWEKRRHAARFAPAASARFLNPDLLVVFLTQEAERTVFADFQAALPPDLPVQPVGIPPGGNQAELGEIARLVNRAVEQGEEVAFDLTHGPLSFPLVGLLVAIFLRTSREVPLKAILYGAYGIDQGVSPGQTPMFDLGLMLSWVEWFIAVNRFNLTGDANDLAFLVKEQRKSLARLARGDPQRLGQLGGLGKLAGVLTSISLSLHMIRPHQAMQHISDLEARVHSVGPLLERGADPLSYSVLLDSILDTYAPLALDDPAGSENVRPTLEVERRMINWYAQRELWVETITLSREWVINWAMVQLGLTDITHLTARFRVESVVSAEAKDYLAAKRKRQSYNSVFLKDLPCVEDLLALWLSLSDVRNDVNHAGMRDKPGKPETLMARIQDCLDVINNLPI